MFIAFITGPSSDSPENLPSEMVLDLRSNTLEDAKNELYAMFGLIPGQQGYYRPNELGKATICEVVSTLTENDISTQREEASRLEAEAYAEAEARREMEQFERSKKKHRR